MLADFLGTDPRPRQAHTSQIAVSAEFAAASTSAARRLRGQVPSLAPSAAPANLKNGPRVKVEVGDCRHQIMDRGELRNIEDAIRIGADLRHCWFRGHSRIFGSLLPSVHREPFVSARENIEFWAGQRFRLRAASYHADLPKWDDYVSWLLLMQHHCVPTRLLDWTENVLVALYFAVSDTESEDGELWCMNHGELNWRSANWKDCFPDTPPIRYLAAAAFIGREELAKFAIDVRCPTINGPLALVPPFQFPRMAAQMSRFTVHPSPDSQEQIGFLLRGPSLVRYIVPANAKRDLAGRLARLGFSHETLYRSLDALGRTIRGEIVEPDFEIEPPPEFGGVH
jgi:hypothetical protein